MILRQIIFDNHTFLYALCRHSSMSENKYVIGIRSNAYTPMCFLISVKNSYTFRYALTQPSQQNANTGTDGGSRGSLAVAQILALRQYGSHTAGRGRGGSNPASWAHSLSQANRQTGRPARQPPGSQAGQAGELTKPVRPTEPAGSNFYAVLYSSSPRSLRSGTPECSWILLCTGNSTLPPWCSHTFQAIPTPSDWEVFTCVWNSYTFWCVPMRFEWEVFTYVSRNDTFRCVPIEFWYVLPAFPVDHHCVPTSSNKFQSVPTERY